MFKELNDHNDVPIADIICRLIFDRCSVALIRGLKEASKNTLYQRRRQLHRHYVGVKLQMK